MLTGGYVLRESAVDGPAVRLVAAGPVMTETLEAATILESEGVQAAVVDVTSLDRLYRDWRNHGARVLDPLLRDPSGAAVPLVTVHDASPHAMAWLGSVFGAPTVPLGVDRFGQSGSIGDLYRMHGLDAESIVNAALRLAEWRSMLDPDTASPA